MAWNVPDDWGMYYHNCGYCNSRYHASEGGCDCDGHTNKSYLRDSGYSYDSGEWSRVISSKVHTARVNHIRKSHAWRPLKGDKYRLTITRYILDENGNSRHEKVYKNLGLVKK